MTRADCNALGSFFKAHFSWQSYLKYMNKNFSSSIAYGDDKKTKQIRFEDISRRPRGYQSFWSCKPRA